MTVRVYRRPATDTRSAEYKVCWLGRTVFVAPDYSAPDQFLAAIVRALGWSAVVEISRREIGQTGYEFEVA
jgi:hypothetical protein